jgi:Mor family transcriptional regulator
MSVNANSDSVNSTPSKRNAVTAEVSSAVCEDYKSGTFTQEELANKYSLSVPTVNRLIKASGAKPEKRKYQHKDNRFVERNALIVAKHDAGASTRELSAEFNVTHQNISLILKKAGRSPIAIHKDRLSVKSAARSQRIAGEKANKKAAKFEKIQKLSDMWKSGAKVAEMREVAGLKSDNALQVKIVLLRRKYPDLFPKRPAFGRTALQSAEGQAERLAKVEKMSAAWNAGKTPAECAESAGWSVATFVRTLPHLRKEFGEVKFAYRRNPKARDASPVVDVEDFTPSV